MTGKAKSNNKSFEAFQQETNAKFEFFMSQNSNIDHGQFFTTPPPSPNSNVPLLKSGGVMDGAIGYNASKIKIISDTIDIGGDSGKYAGVVILESETGTTDTLSTINNFQLSFQGQKLIAKEGHTITIDNANNIDVSSSIILTNQQFVTVRYDILTNKWKIDGGSGGGGSSPPFIDSDPLIKGSVDATKLLKFEIDGFTTATTRTITIPNSTTTMAGLGVTSQTWTGENIFAGNMAVRDTNFFIQNIADITKQLKFDLSGANTGKILSLASNHSDNRVITFPNNTTTLAGLDVLSQSWNGFNTFFGGMLLFDINFFISSIADVNKKIQFNLSGATTLTTLTLASIQTTNRTLTFPNTTTNLAGLGVLSQTWTGTNIFAGNTTVRDTNFFIQQTADITKQLKFDLAGTTTGKVTTLDFNPTDNRTLTFPNSTTTIAGLGVLSQTFTGTNIFAGNTSVRDTNFFIQNTVDITKQLKFDIAGSTTGKVLTLESNHTDNRTLTLPNSSTDLAGLGVVSQTWTGTNIFAGNTTVRDTNFFIQQTADITKQVKFNLVDATTGKVSTLKFRHTDNRLLTFPDAETIIAGLDVPAQEWTQFNFFSGLLEVVDDFRILNIGDNNKKIKFNAAVITSGQVRTITIPDSTTTMAGLGVVSQTFTGTNIFAGITNVRDSNYFIQNQSDNSKQVKWDLSGISTSTIRTLTLPNSTTTLAGLGVVSQDWTGTNNFFGPTLFNGNVTLGNSSTDSVTFIADTIGNITPNTDDTDDLGAPTQAWDFIYVKSGHAIIEGYATGFRPSNQTNTGIQFTVPTAGGLTELRVVFQTGGSILMASEV